MLKQLTWVLALILAVSAAPVRAAEGQTDPAAQQIETFYAALVDSMKHGKELGPQGRFKQLTPVVEQTFDLPLMAQLTVGPAWTMMSDEDKKAIIQAFERMTVANYAKNFATYEGQKFDVDPNVKMRNADKIVETKMIGSDGKPIPFNYRMRIVDGKWQIVDIYLNGYVSQLALRRSDFASTVASSGAAGLVKRMNELVDKQLAGG
jgi:phospholipid transport system substrate-binding protein